MAVIAGIRTVDPKRDLRELEDTVNEELEKLKYVFVNSVEVKESQDGFYAVIFYKEATERRKQ